MLPGCVAHRAPSVTPSSSRMTHERPRPVVGARLPLGALGGCPSCHTPSSSAREIAGHALTHPSPSRPPHAARPHARALAQSCTCAAPRSVLGVRRTEDGSLDHVLHVRHLLLKLLHLRLHAPNSHRVLRDRKRHVGGDACRPTSDTFRAHPAPSSHGHHPAHARTRHALRQPAPGRECGRAGDH